MFSQIDAFSATFWQEMVLRTRLDESVNPDGSTLMRQPWATQGSNSSNLQHASSGIWNRNDVNFGITACDPALIGNARSVCRQHRWK